MDKIQDIQVLGHAPISKLFIRYTLPAIASMIIMSIQIFIDGIFVGHAIGSAGLAAINIVVPVFNFIIALGLLLGIGGATVVSIKHGEGNTEEANKYFTQSLVLMIVVSVLVIGLGEVYLDEMAYLLGADKSLLPYVKDYMQILLWFSGFIILGDGVSALVRNDGGPNCAMVALILCSVVNCILDYIFIFIMGWGLKGAALGTGIAQIVLLIVLLFHFLSSKASLRLCKFSFNINNTIRIIKNGLTNFVGEFSWSLVVMAFNLVLMDIAGEKGVAAYAVMMYISSVAAMIILGIGQGIQPIISYNFGALQLKRVNQIYKLSNQVSMIIGAVIFVITVLTARYLAVLFLPNDVNMVNMVANGIKIYFTDFLMMGFNICSITYFQAVEKADKSLILSLLRGCVLVVIGLLVLPEIFGINGVWLSMPAAEFITMLLAIFMVKSNLADQPSRMNIKALLHFR